MSEEKFSKCEEGKKNVSVEFRVFGKKRKVPEKKIRVFWVEILLSSCSLVGLYVNLQIKVTEKKRKFSEYFSGECLKLKLRLQRKFKVRDFYLLDSYPLVGRHVVKHG